jgi:hypothetical protein
MALHQCVLVATPLSAANKVVPTIKTCSKAVWRIKSGIPELRTTAVIYLGQQLALFYPLLCPLPKNFEMI